MIQFDHLTKRYGAFAAVTDLNVTIAAGTLVGLLGPNGAGKTTILRCLAGILLPTEGRVLVGDLDVQRDRTAKARLGVVPDRPFVYDKLTAEEFLRFVAALYGKRGARVTAVIDDLMAEFRLSDWRHEPLGAFSHGMRQKVLLMAGFVHEAPYLLVDEPMVGLDAHAAVILKDRLRRYTAGGGTVLLTTHTMSVAEELCDRVLILSKGRVVADGSVAAVTEEFKTTAGGSLEEAFLAVTRDAGHDGDERMQAANRERASR
jgi:ABC-2 type transport system ATP-binding protein